MELSRDARSLHSATDFSIDRILRRDGDADACVTRPSNKPASPPPAEAPPSWLFCSRYQPPRIPRGSGGSGGGGGGRARRAGRHARVPFTAAQSTALEAAFERAPYLAPPALRALAHALQLREDRIKIWFQNRRARDRREKSVFALPPQAVSIPPTARLLRPPVQTYANFMRLPHAFHTLTDSQGTMEAQHAREEHIEECRESIVDVESLDDDPILPKR